MLEGRGLRVHPGVHDPASERILKEQGPSSVGQFLPGVRIFIELMTSDRKLKASREGSK